jgi:hypothetical protein
MYFISLFPSIDLFLLFLFILVLVLHLVFVKKQRLFIDIVAVYTSFVLVILLPLLFPTIHDWLASHALARVGSFVACVVMLHIVLTHSNIGNFSSRIKPVEFAVSLVYRVSIIGLMCTSILYFAPSGIKNQLGGITDFLFSNMYALICWFFLPLILAFAYRFHSKSGWVE